MSWIICYYDHIMKPTPNLLSKTKLIRDYRCLKCIYLTIHQPEFETAITPDTQALFNKGNEVGAKAREYYHGNDTQRAFSELISPSTSPDKKSSLKIDMLEYCKQDTLVMVKLVKLLYEQ